MTTHQRLVQTTDLKLEEFNKLKYNIHKKDKIILIYHESSEGSTHYVGACIGCRLVCF